MRKNSRILDFKKGNKSINCNFDPLKNYDNKNKDDYMQFVDTTAREVLGKKYIFFNADGLRNNVKSIEYEIFFLRETQ